MQHQGIYTGKITVKAQGLGKTELNVNLRVLPIVLEEPFLEYSMYYRGFLGSGMPERVSSEQKTPEQLEAEFKNLKAHGITNPDIYQPYNKPYFDQYLDIRKKSGLKMDPMYYLGVWDRQFHRR